MAKAAADRLFEGRLVRFGVPATEARKIVSDRRIAHQWGPNKRDVEYLSFATFNTSLFQDAGGRFYSVPTMAGLALAEHVARVFHNWDRCYAVDTSRLAMMARG